MKTYKASLTGTEYNSIAMAMTEAGNSWNWEKDIHECNGFERLTVYEIDGNSVRPVFGSELFKLIECGHVTSINN